MTKITAKTTIEELIEKNPKATEIFLRWGLPCLTCGEPFWGSIEELAGQNQFEKIDELLEELNRPS